MVVQAHDEKGNEVLVIDPSGVYLTESPNQAEFRIFGQQRLKKFGFNLVQDGDGNGVDHLLYKGGVIKIPLRQESGILTMAMTLLELDKGNKEALESVIDGMDKEEDPDHCIRLTTASLILN